MDLLPAHNQLKALFNQHLVISEEVWMACLPDWQPYAAGRRTILTAAGERERYLYFVTEGIQRIYYLSEDGTREATLVFTASLH
jgi:CRP-like cAMP-binding protein